MLAMVFGVNIFTHSGFIEWVFKSIKIANNTLTAILPMAIMRPISGSATLALLNDILYTYGPDSYIGKLACVIEGSTDTTFYVLTLYFGSIGIKKIRYSIIAGLTADIVGIVSAILIVSIFLS